MASNPFDGLISEEEIQAQAAMFAKIQIQQQQTARDPGAAIRDGERKVHADIPKQAVTAPTATPTTAAPAATFPTTILRQFPTLQSRGADAAVKINQIIATQGSVDGAALIKKVFGKVTDLYKASIEQLAEIQKELGEILDAAYIAQAGLNKCLIKAVNIDLALGLSDLMPLDDAAKFMRGVLRTAKLPMPGASATFEAIFKKIQDSKDANSGSMTKMLGRCWSLATTLDTVFQLRTIQDGRREGNYRAAILQALIAIPTGNYTSDLGMAKLYPIYGNMLNEFVSQALESKNAKKAAKLK